METIKQITLVVCVHLMNKASKLSQQGSSPRSSSAPKNASHLTRTPQNKKATQSRPWMLCHNEAPEEHQTNSNKNNCDGDHFKTSNWVCVHLKNKASKLSQQGSSPRRSSAPKMHDASQEHPRTKKHPVKAMDAMPQ